MAALLPPLRDELIEVQPGVSLRVRTSRTADGAPVIVLVHGFPECWYAWRGQIAALHQAGWRVVVPELRGFGQSSKPLGAANYRLDLAAKDLIGLLDAIGAPTATLVGHDLGGQVAWWTAANFPNRIDRLVIASAPHPALQRLALAQAGGVGTGLPSMLLRLPLIPDFAPHFHLDRLIGRALLRQVNQGALTEKDLALMGEEWMREGALRAMLNWYAAPPPPAAASDRIAAPTLILWGERDTLVGSAAADAALGRCTNGKVQKLANAGHFPHLDAPDAFTAALVGFVGTHEKLKEWRPPQW